MQVGKIVAYFLQQGSHSLGRFINEKAVSTVRDTLGGAGISDEHAGETAGSSFTDNKAVGVEGGGEKEQISSGVPGTENIAVVNGADENAFIADTEGGSLFLQQLLIRALADKHHAKVLSGIMQHAQCIENQGQAFVGHQAAYEEEHGNPRRQIIA